MVKDQIEKAMEARGWKVAQLAVYAEVSDAAVYNILNGADPKLSTIARIARALELKVCDLIDEGAVDQYLDSVKNRMAPVGAAA